MNRSRVDESATRMKAPQGTFSLYMISMHFQHPYIRHILFAMRFSMALGGHSFTTLAHGLEPSISPLFDDEIRLLRIWTLFVTYAICCATSRYSIQTIASF